MRDSVVDLEQLLVTLHKEITQDKTFLSGLLDHKNATIAWFRDRQATDIADLNELFNAILLNQRESTASLNKLYEDMTATLHKEVALIEAHLNTYEKGTLE